MTRGILIAGLCLIAWPAAAQRLTNISTQALGADCNGAQGREEQCSSYIDGIADTVAFFQRLRPADGSKGPPLPAYTCVPNNVTGAQLRSTVGGWIRAHSDKGREQASGAVMEALHDAFPCR